MKSAERNAADLEARLVQLDARAAELPRLFHEAAVAGDVDTLLALRREIDDLPTLRAATALAAAHVAVRVCEERIATLEPVVEAAKVTEAPLHAAVRSLGAHLTGLYSQTGKDARARLPQVQADLVLAREALAAAEAEHAEPRSRLRREQANRISALERVRRAEVEFTPHRAPVVRSLRHAVPVVGG